MTGTVLTFPSTDFVGVVRATDELDTEGITAGVRTFDALAAVGFDSLSSAAFTCAGVVGFLFGIGTGDEGLTLS